MNKVTIIKTFDVRGAFSGIIWGYIDDDGIAYGWTKPVKFSGAGDSCPPQVVDLVKQNAMENLAAIMGDQFDSKSVRFLEKSVRPVCE